MIIINIHIQDFMKHEDFSLVGTPVSKLNTRFRTHQTSLFIVLYKFFFQKVTNFTLHKTRLYLEHRHLKTSDTWNYVLCQNRTQHTMIWQQTLYLFLANGIGQVCKGNTRNVLHYFTFSYKERH